MGHDHSHHIENERALFWAIIVNTVLTAVQVIGGILSGSLSLLADALHNFSDAGSLFIAFLAQKISGMPADGKMTFGYGRAQILGALINSVILGVVGIYLFAEAIERFSNPTVVNGELIIWVAAGALVVDLFTAWLTQKGAAHSVNMRAAFIHNLTDAMASLVVIASGIGIVLFDIYWIDPLATVLISLYVLYHSFVLIKSCIRTLMQAVPKGIDREGVKSSLLSIQGVDDIHHIHIWEIHEKFRSLEAHVVVAEASFGEWESLKKTLKTHIHQKFGIHHSTFELETVKDSCRDDIQ